MSVFFDYKVQLSEPASVNVAVEWHVLHPLLAISSYSQEKGGFLNICNDLGEPLSDVTCPHHPIAQVTALKWHPSKNLLMTGWENGEMQVWRGDKDFNPIESPHQVPIIVLEWSGQGGRLISGDTSGSLVGWKIDPSGQFQVVFHLELKDAITHVLFRKDSPKDMGYDMSGLARAAVAGDEIALDMFSAWRPRTAGTRFSFPAVYGDSARFFVGSVSGIVYYVTEDGTISEVLNLEGMLVRKMLYHDNKDILVIMTEGLCVGQFAVDSKGNLSEIMKVKLSGRAQDASMAWAGQGLLAVATGELAIRCWHLETGDNYLLEGSPATGEATAAASNLPSEVFTDIAFNRDIGLLCAGSNLGRICMWRRRAGGGGADGEGDAENQSEGAWHVERACHVRGCVKQLAWSACGLLAANAVAHVLLLRQHTLCSAYCDHVLAIQVGASELTIEVLESDNTKHCSCDLKTDIQINGVAVTSSHLAVWSKKTMVVYSLHTNYSGDTATISSKVVGSWACEAAEACALAEQTVVVLSNGQTQLFSLSGALKQTLPVSAVEGAPIALCLSAAFLCVAYAGGCVRVWDLARREAKPHSSSKNLGDEISDFGEIISACCNKNGTKVSITIAKSNFVPDTKLYIWDIESDSLSFLDFGTGKLDKDEAVELNSIGEGSLESNEESSESLERAVRGRFVLSHQWDAEEARLLVCETKRHPTLAPRRRASDGRRRRARPASSATITLQTSQREGPSLEESEVVLVSIFISDQGLHIQDILPISSEFTKLLGVHAPYYLLLKKLSEKSKINSEKIIMRDFDGLQNCDQSTREAVLNFSYNLSVGNMDEAFRAIKMVKSEAVWQSLARMCVKTQRVDVAAVCLAHTRHARAAMMVREARAQAPGQPQAQVAMLAAQLGMLDEATRLYASCGRYDLLNQLLQSAGEWERALQVAEEKDRIHLRATYFQYARHLESKGDVMGAAHMYERSDTHRTQVPRLLLDDPLALEAYVLREKDPALTKWWAQYMESSGQMELALQFYREAKDYFSLVRVLCFQQDIAQAAQVARESGDRAACYHLARHYEAAGAVADAVHFFTRARAYANAVRICKEHGIEDQLWSLALLAGPREQLEAARYFEANGVAPDKAVMLYHRAGMLHKALDLAFKTQQYSSLQHIAIDLNSNSDPALILKCAQFFVKNNQFDKAVELLAVGKQYTEALDLCLEKNIPVTEDLAEKLTMGKDEGNESTRVRVLEKVAESAMAQGNYHLATKKFTQAGNKLKAMKALLKSGDTEKIIFFANVSRQKDIFVMAANYLQSLDWKNTPEVLRNIVLFYTKGKAPALLANFYVACAQVEIDEYQDYEKALGALVEASRSLTKVSQPSDAKLFDKTMEDINARTALVRRFVEIRRMFERGDSESAISMSRQLLEGYSEPGSVHESAVRVGDIYAAMIDHKVSAGDIREAHRLIDEFSQRAPRANLQYYVGASTLEKIAHALGLPLASLIPQMHRSDASSAENNDEVFDPEEVDDVQDEVVN